MWGVVMKGHKLQDDITHCQETNKRITFVVTECSAHQERDEPSLRQMEIIAWKIDADKKTGRAGFRPPKIQTDE